MIDVCLCTHNPRPKILKRVFASIQNQSCGRDKFRFLVVDNASYPPLDESFINEFTLQGIDARIVREAVPGIARARLRAILETQGEWLLFVDDDNELARDYIEEGTKFASEYEDVGCFGGKLLLAPGLCPPEWVRPFLTRLAVKDIGEEVIFGKHNEWGPWEPPTAGAFIKRPVLDRYRQRAEEDQSIFKLGRVGRKNLSSCEDSLIMRSAYSLDLANAYNPKMVLFHHLDKSRFKLSYLMRLMFSYGTSHVLLEHLLNNKSNIPDDYRFAGKFLMLLFKTFKGAANQSFAFGIGIVAYHIGAGFEYLRQYRNRK